MDDQLATPDWLTVSGSYRLRYEWLDHTYRAIDPGTDQLLVSRLLLKAEASNDRFRAGVELQDSRSWLAGNRTPLGTDDVNALEPLQMYVGLRGNDWFRSGDSVDLTLGRFTMGMGSNRLIGDYIYRNTRSGFDGVRARWSLEDGPRVQAFITNPVQRLPFTPAELRDADIEFDEGLSSVFWGAHVDRIDLLGLDAAVYLYGLDESDGGGALTRNRDFLTAGFRLLESRGNWSWEVESAYQFGDIRETPLPAANRLDHSAWTLHANLAVELTGAWRPELELLYDYASGDGRPGDGSNGRFDFLFGPQRFDWGPTGIYGALRRTNINSPGAYVNLFPAGNMVWMIGYRAAWLAEKRDFFGASGVRDVTGESGSFVGHQIETRFRWNIVPGSFRFEMGGATLFKGDFLEDAPLAPPSSNTIYLYSNFLLSF